MMKISVTTFQHQLFGPDSTKKLIFNSTKLSINLKGDNYST